MLKIRSRVKYFIFLLFIFFSSVDASSNDDLIKTRFSKLQKEYFLKLDLQAPHSELQKIPQFVAQLDALVNEQNVAPISDKELSGLILIYDAMLNSNIIIGIVNHKLNLADFTKIKHFAKQGATPNEELQARAQYDLSLLEKAAILRPNDHRIDIWIVSARSTLIKLQTGQISDAIKQDLLKAISIRPSFNLWTAILLLHNEPIRENQGLVTAAKNFVDLAAQGKDSCARHPEDCTSTWKAPYNFQAAVTELGDVFLRQAEYYLEQNDIENAMKMAEYANGTYAQLFNRKHITDTEKWPDYNAFSVRKKRLTEIQNQKNPKNALHLMKQYQRVYECSSCHGRVTTNLRTAQP